MTPTEPITGGESPEDFRSFLRREWLKRSRKNPRYSLRAFAQTLNYDASSLSKILRGSRPLGKNLIRRFGTELGLNPTEILLFQRQKRTADPASQSDRWELPQEIFQAISDWYHFAILELLSVEGFQRNAVWIARSLDISVAEAKDALGRLERLELIESDGRGGWRGRSTTSLGSAEFTATAYRNMQRQLLEKALGALETVPLAERDHTSMVFAVDPGDLPELKAQLKHFRRSLVDSADRPGKRKRAVYCLNLALYPLTHFKPRKERDEKSKTH